MEGLFFGCGRSKNDPFTFKETISNSFIRRFEQFDKDDLNSKKWFDFDAIPSKPNFFLDNPPHQNLAGSDNKNVGTIVDQPSVFQPTTKQFARCGSGCKMGPKMIPDETAIKWATALGNADLYENSEGVATALKLLPKRVLCNGVLCDDIMPQLAIFSMECCKTGNAKNTFNRGQAHLWPVQAQGLVERLENSGIFGYSVDETDTFTSEGFPLWTANWSAIMDPLDFACISYLGLTDSLFSPVFTKKQNRPQNGHQEEEDQSTEIFSNTNVDGNHSLEEAAAAAVAVGAATAQARIEPHADSCAGRHLPIRFQLMQRAGVEQHPALDVLVQATRRHL